MKLGTFDLEGQSFRALNGGPMFKFTPAISFHVACETQAEIDHLWSKLAEGGEGQACGWVQDKFGVSWQIIPHNLGDLKGDPDAERAGRVMQAMLQMKKLDTRALQAAYDGA